MSSIIEKNQLIFKDKIPYKKHIVGIIATLMVIYAGYTYIYKSDIKCNEAAASKCVSYICTNGYKWKTIGGVKVCVTC